MKVFNIVDAMGYLKDRYGSENMPSCEETLRRAIRTGDLKVQEAGDPGRKGYTITEQDLVDYAEKRMSRLGKSRKRIEIHQGAVPVAYRMEEMVKFPDLYEKYLNGTLDKDQYLLALFHEKTKWETKMKQYKEDLARVEMERLKLENEIHDCQSAIESFAIGIQSM